MDSDPANELHSFDNGVGVVQVYRPFWVTGGGSVGPLAPARSCPLICSSTCTSAPIPSFSAEEEKANERQSTPAGSLYIKQAPRPSLRLAIKWHSLTLGWCGRRLRHWTLQGPFSAHLCLVLPSAGLNWWQAPLRADERNDALHFKGMAVMFKP